MTEDSTGNAGTDGMMADELPRERICFLFSPADGSFQGTVPVFPAPHEPGAWLVPANGTLVSPPEATDAWQWDGGKWQAVPDPATRRLENARERALAELRALIDQAGTHWTEAYSGVERASWPGKVLRARQLADGTLADDDLAVLSVEADARHITAAAFAGLILEKAAALDLKAARALAMSHEFAERIATAATPGDIGSLVDDFREKLSGISAT